MYNITKFWYIILIILAAIYFYFYKYKQNNKENFISSIRPPLRNMRLKYEHFMNNYAVPSHKYIMKKFK